MVKTIASSQSFPSPAVRLSQTMTLDINYILHRVILRVQHNYKRFLFIVWQVIIMGDIIKGKKHAGSIIIRAKDEDSFPSDQLYTWGVVNYM